MSQGCHTKLHKPGSLRQQKSTLSRSGGLKPEMKVSAGPALIERSGGQSVHAYLLTSVVARNPWHSLAEHTSLQSLPSSSYGLLIRVPVIRCRAHSKPVKPHFN